MYYKLVIRNGVFDTNIYKIESLEWIDNLFKDKDEKDLVMFHQEGKDGLFISTLLSKSSDTLIGCVTDKGFTDGFRIGLMHGSAKLLDIYREGGKLSEEIIKGVENGI